MMLNFVNKNFDRGILTPSHQKHQSFVLYSYMALEYHDNGSRVLFLLHSKAEVIENGKGFLR